MQEKTSSQEVDISFIRRVLLVLFIGTFFFRVSTGTSSLLDEVVIWKVFEAEGFAYATIVLLIVIYGMSFSFIEGMIAGSTGFAVDVVGPKKIIVFAGIMSGISMLIYWLAKFMFYLFGLYVFYATLLLAQLIEGITSSLKVTPTAAIIARYSEYESRAFRMGLWDSILMFGRIIGTGLAGLFYGIFAKKHPVDGLDGFLIIAAISFLVAIIYYIWLPDIPPEKDFRGSVIKEALRHFGEGAKVMFSGLRKDLGATWLSMSALWGLAFTLGPIIILTALGASGEATGYITAVIIGVLALPAPFWGYVADRIGRKPVAVIGITGLVLSVILGAVAYLYLHLPTSDVRFYLVLSPGIFCISAITPSFLGRLADTALPGERGLTMSGYQFVTSIGEITGVITGGAFWIIFSHYLTPFFQEHFLGWQPDWTGALGVAIAGLMFFLLTLFFGYRLRSDEEVMKMLQEISEK